MKNSDFLRRIAKLLTIFALATVFAVPTVYGIQAKQETAQALEGRVADLFMMAGQSNAAGSTRKTSTPSGIEYPYAPKENVLYYGETHRTTTQGQGSSYKRFNLDPVQHGCGFSLNHVGFELGMANLLDVLPEYQGANRKAVIFKSAAGGTSVFPETMPTQYGNWYPPSLWAENYYETSFNYHTGLQYRAFMDNLKNLVVKLEDEGFTQINVKGLFWMQGCSDRGREDAYKAIVKTMITDMRHDIGEIIGTDCSNMPVYIGEISETFGSALPSSVEANLKMIECQHEIASEMRNVYVAEIKHYHINKLNSQGQSEVLGSDSAHYNYEDVVALGEDFTRLYFDTFGKFDSYVNFEIDQTEVGVKDLYKLNFTGKYGGNYNADTEEITFDLTIANTQRLSSITAENATVTFVKDEYYNDTTNKVHSYKLTNISGEVKVNAKITQNKSYSVKVKCNDETYGTEPNSKYIEKAYSGCKYVLKTFPETYGAVEKFIINGTEVPGAVDKHDFTFDDLEIYVKDGESVINIEIVYGEYNAVKQKLENTGNNDNQQGGGDSDSSGSSSDEGGKDNCKTASAGSLLGLIVLCVGGMWILKRR